MMKRTWQTAMEEIVKVKQDSTRERYIMAMQDAAFEILRNIIIFQTRQLISC